MTYIWTGPFPEGGGRLEGAVVQVTVALGLSSIRLEVHDPYDVSAPVTTSIAVVDRTPPSLAVSISPNALWPPNHGMRPVHAGVTASDTCDPDPAVRLVSVTSSEPEDGTGDGDLPQDIQGASVGTPDVDFQLRAERQGGGSGRIYEVCYTATDQSSNVATYCATVTVPHDRRAAR